MQGHGNSRAELLARARAAVNAESGPPSELGTAHHVGVWCVPLLALSKLRWQRLHHQPFRCCAQQIEIVSLNYNLIYRYLAAG